MTQGERYQNCNYWTLLLKTALLSIKQSRKRMRILGVSNNILEGIFSQSGWNTNGSDRSKLDYSGYSFLIENIDTVPTLYFTRLGNIHEGYKLVEEHLPSYMFVRLLNHVTKVSEQQSNLERSYGSLTWYIVDQEDAVPEPLTFLQKLRRTTRVFQYEARSQCRS